MTERGWRIVFALCLICAAALRFALIARPVAAIDLTYLPDDTYYVLSIARELAAGRSPSADGVVATSGFQPLFTMMAVPIFWIVDDADGAIRAIVALSAAWSIAAIALLGLLTRHLSNNSLAAVGAMAFAAVAPPFVRNDLNGLETSLAAAVALGLFLVVATTRPDPPLRRLLAIGMLAGLAPLARIDLSFAVLALGVWALWRHGPKETMTVAAVASLVAAPWIAWCFAVGGSPFPESGQAVRHILAPALEVPLLVFAYLEAMVAWNLVDDALGPTPRALTVTVLALGLVAPVLYARTGQVKPLGLTLAATAAMFFAFYLIYLPAIWFYERYLHLALLITVILGADLVARLGRAWRGAGAVSLTILSVILVLNLRVHPIGEPIPEAPRGLSGYRAVALELLPLLPEPPGVLAAMQSGALGYFAPPGWRVVNLDGVVNGEALRAARASRLCAYLAEVDATYFADWPYNLGNLIRDAGVPSDALGYVQIAEAETAPLPYRSALWSLDLECQ